MNNKTILSAAMLAAFACVGAAGDASASGFQLCEQGGDGQGNAYAGSTAKAYDASTVFFNPAGMTRLGNTAGSSVSYIAVNNKFKGLNRFRGIDWRGD